MHPKVIAPFVGSKVIELLPVGREHSVCERRGIRSEADNAILYPLELELYRLGLGLSGLGRVGLSLRLGLLLCFVQELTLLVGHAVAFVSLASEEDDHHVILRAP